MLYPRSQYHHGRRLLGLVSVCLLGLLVLSGTRARMAAPSATLKAAAQEIVPAATPTPTPGTRYRQTNLVSDLPGFALIQDPLVVNPWGVAMTSSSPFWLANNGTSTASLYRGDVGSTIFAKQPGMSFITIPPPGLPTGAVANTGGTSDFILTSGAGSARANFLFA